MVEEYGFDLTGAHNGFPSAMAVIFGQPLAGPSETKHAMKRS